MTHLPGKFVWHEHLSNDVSKARAFYESLFGWHVESMPIGTGTYSVIRNGDTGIGGFDTAPPGAPSAWMSYLSVADVDASADAAKAAGARILNAPMDYGTAGRAAVLADPTGAVFALWKGTTGDRPDTAATAHGDWFWNELSTPDEEPALAFYEKVFGLTRDSMDMGPMGTYYVLKSGDTMRGGVMKSMDKTTPPMWLPYVSVADCDGCAAQAQQLGAQVVTRPTDIPDVGRFALMRDPSGAMIAVIKPLPR